MRSKLVTRATERARTWVVALEPGDEVVASLLEFAREHDIHGARVTGLGAVSSSVIAFFHRHSRSYDEIVVDDQMEVLSLVGNIAQYEGEPRVHAHVVLGDAEGHTSGGHLVSARVWPTLELTIDVHDEPLYRELAEASGLPLLVP